MNFLHSITLDIKSWINNSPFLRKVCAFISLFVKIWAVMYTLIIFPIIIIFVLLDFLIGPPEWMILKIIAIVAFGLTWLVSMIVALVESIRN
jgi:hypothetical protein